MRIYRGISLLETLIAMVIVSMLSAILVKTYIQMSEISVRIGQEKKVTQEILFVSEYLQNLADNSTIDYNKYLTTIADNSGFVDILYLTGQMGQVAIYSTGSNCVYIKDNIQEQTGDCYLEANIDNKLIKLTNTGSARFSPIIFKIIPLASTDMYYSHSNNNVCTTNYLACLNHPGFWILGKAYSINYNKQKRSANIAIDIQQFFNLSYIND